MEEILLGVSFILSCCYPLAPNEIEENQLASIGYGKPLVLEVVIVDWILVESSDFKFVRNGRPAVLAVGWKPVVNSVFSAQILDDIIKWDILVPLLLIRE